MALAFLTLQAERDLLAIWVYVAEQNPQAADRLIESLHGECQRLADFPGMGRERATLSPCLRSLPVGKYVVFYRVQEYGISVERVLHGSRDTTYLFPGNEATEEPSGE